jgi:hypothetical protein
MFLSSLKYDPGFFYPSRIPDSGVKKAPDLGSATLSLNINPVQGEYEGQVSLM